MKKQGFKMLLASVIMLAAFAGTIIVSNTSYVFAAGGYTVSPAVDFSMQCGHTDGGTSNLYNVKAEPVTGKVAKITMDGNAAPTVTRIYYGEDQKPYGVDLRDFEMKFTIDQLAPGWGFHIAFMSNQMGYPLGNFGSGISFRFLDENSGNNARDSLEIRASAYPGDTESNWNPSVPDMFNNGVWWLRWDNPAAGKTYIGEEISMKITEDGSNLKVVITFTNGTPAVYYGSSGGGEMYIPKTAFEAANTDYTNATLFITPDHFSKGSSMDDVILTINSIDEPNTAAYNNIKNDVIDWLDTCVSEFESLNTFDEFIQYISSAPNTSITLRKADLYSNPDLSQKVSNAATAEAEAITRILNAVDTKLTTDFDNRVHVPHVQLGSMAKVDNDATKLFLINKLAQGMQSAISYTKPLNIKDFEMVFSIDTVFMGGRITFLFVKETAAWDYPENSIAGFKLTIGIDNNAAWFIMSDAKTAAIPGVKTNQWGQVENQSDTSLQQITYSTGDKVTIRIAENSSGDYELSVSANNTSMNVVIANSFFTNQNINPESVYLKMYAGDGFTGFIPQTKYVEMTIDSITDMNYKAFKALVNEYNNFDVNSIETYLNSKTKLSGINANDFRFADSAIKTQFENKQVTNLTFLKNKLTEYATVYKNAAKALADQPTAEGIDEVKEGSRATFIQYTDLLNDLTTSERDAIIAIYNEGEEGLNDAICAVFRAAHAATLELTVNTVTISDKQGVLDVLAAFDELPELAKAELSAEKTLLNNLLSKISQIEQVVKSIAITMEPTKKLYNVGQDLDLTGLVVTATRNDNTTFTLSSDQYTVTGYNKNAAGAQTITVSYEGLTATFTVTVNEIQSKGCKTSMIGVTGMISLFAAALLIMKQGKSITKNIRGKNLQ